MTTPTPSIRTMAESLATTAGQAIRHGAAPYDVYEERLRTCFECDSFIQETKRCAECGCFMIAKARVGGDPAKLCPLQKWSR